VSSYCTETDLYEKGGAPRGIFANPARLIASVSASTDILTLDDHGLALDTQGTLRAEAGGSLPSPLVADTVYYAIPVTTSTFKLAATAGGAAINLTTAGSNVVVIVPLPVTQWITSASALVDQMLVSHAVPLAAPYPDLVVQVTASLAAAYGLSYVGHSQANIESKLQWAQQMLRHWSPGVPLRGANVPASTNCAIRGTTAGSDPRGWVPTGGGGIP